MEDLVVNTLYIDAFSGVSGDMLLGALLDLGVDIEVLKQELQKLPVNSYTLTCQQTAKNGIWGTDFDVIIDEHKAQAEVDHQEAHHHAHHHEHNHAHHGRTYTDIVNMIEGSSLSSAVKHNSLAIFAEIAKAEAKVHHKSIEEIHFHEVGAIDSIVDIVGNCIALDLLQIDEIITSPLTDGCGTITCAHGVMPVPVPAVMQMRQGSNIPVNQNLNIHTELITPTGMGMVKVLSKSFGSIPENAVIEKIGYGFGKRETGSLNALRVLLLSK